MIDARQAWALARVAQVPLLGFQSSTAIQMKRGGCHLIRRGTLEPEQRDLGHPGERPGFPRIYHSCALLLPDGRVLSLGGGRPKAKNGGQHNKNAEIFEPPYLFAPNGQLGRSPRDSFGADERGLRPEGVREDVRSRSSPAGDTGSTVVGHAYLQHEPEVSAGLVHVGHRWGDRHDSGQH